MSTPQLLMLPSLVTLKLAMFYDLASGKDGDLTLKPEKSERRLLDLIRQRERPVVLFVDDAHDLHAQTLRGLKQFMEKVAKRGNRLSVVLAGHPKLRNELVNRSTLEEIAARTTVFELEGIKAHQRQYLTWLLEQCLQPEIKLDDVLTETAYCQLICAESPVCKLLSVNVSSLSLIVS